jgi:integrase
LKRASFSGKTRKEVQEKMAKTQVDLQAGNFTAPTKTTVGEWIDIWLHEYKRPDLRPTTWDSYAYLVRVHLKPAIGHIPLKALRPEMVQRLYNEKRAEGLSSRTVRYIHAVLHGALKQAVRNNLLARNVTEATTRPKEEKKEIRPLSQEEARQFLSVVEGDRLSAAFLLALGTGLRLGELLALRWDDLDLKAGTLTVRRGLCRVYDQEDGERKTRLVFQEPKSARSRRTIPMPSNILAALKKHKIRQNEERLLVGAAYGDQGLVFCTPIGTPIDPRNMARHFDGCLRKAGLPHVRFHDLRHTFATLMLELGQSPKTVQEILGHSTISITLDTYTHVGMDLKTQAMEKMNAALQGLKEGP